MKKRHSIHLLLAAAALLLATAACTKDELADGDRLPEGQYPLEIARITLGVEAARRSPGAHRRRASARPWTARAACSTRATPFAVQIDDGTETATYTVQDDGTATSDAPLYWTNTTPNRTVSAWYPATDGTLDLGDQSQSLAYPAERLGHGRLPDTRHADLHPPAGQGARHAHRRCTRRSNLPPALYLHTVYL